MTADGRFGFDDRREIRRLAWAALALFVAGMLAFLARGADRPANPKLVALPRQSVPPFGEVAVRVATGTRAATGCALAADDEAARGQGLRGRTDLAGHVGMLFRFPADTTRQFTMAGTPLRLSIAWFDGAGGFVGAADLEPCIGAASCPDYKAPKPYRLALEVPRGELQALGIGPGGHLTVTGPCS